MTERYHFEHPAKDECYIFDRTVGSSSNKGWEYRGSLDPNKAVATCKDPEFAQRIVDLLNEEEDVKALARTGAFGDNNKESPHG